MPPLRMIFMFLFAVVAVNISNYIFYYRIYTPMNRNCFYVNRNISSQNSINTSTYLSFINNKDITSDNGVSETEYADLMVSLKGLYTFYPLEVKKPGLPRCPEKPPNLGPVVEDTVMKSIKAFDKLYSEVQIGGAYCPTKCVARQRVAIIVPFRNNKSRTNIRHLGTFMYMMHLFLMKQQLEYRIFVIEQASGNRPYNQGKLMNAGYTEVHRRRSGRYRFNCLIFHEPHIVPIDTRNLYRCSRFPRLLSSVLEKPDKSIKNLRFGNAIAISMEQFIRVNGFSNIYWDNDRYYEDLFNRLKNANYSIVRSNPSIGKYVRVKQFEVPVFNQSELAVTSSPLNLIDGLTTWRRFTFFDVQNGADNGKIAECLQDTNVTVATSGNGQVVLCDDTGWAHLISRLWAITSFKAYEITITQAQQLPHDPYLVTIGDDEPGVNPLIKVWDLSRTDRHGNPICVRVSRAVPSHMRPMHVTALAVHENKNLLAVGFQDGSVALYRGDIARQRSGKMRTLAETGSSPITGLAFKGAEKLFVVSRVSVMLVWLSTDRCESLDPMGAAPGCSVLADKHRLTVATNKAIYCYTTEGRGPCYALEGDKVALNCFRSYLVITANEPAAKPGATTSTAPAPRSHHITILDIQNKFIVFSKTFDEIDAVITEWGSFYLLTKKKELIYLNEKDLQSKLSSLFKKNLYDVAIRIASSQHYDVEGLTEIYKQYGDHLYSKGDLKGAIDQYVKTIGWLETSYVIRKYLESRHLEPLIIYLEALHKKGFATEDHTTLLLTCYVKIDQHDQQGKLKEFINTKDKTIDFDVDVAIKVVRQVSVDDALSLAAIHKRHDCYLQIVIEDKKDFKQALDYIVELEFEDADAYMKKYGHRLIQHEPEDSTKLLKLLCTDYKPRSKPLVDETSLSGGHREPDRAAPDDYIHMFLSNSAKLIEFLEHMVAHNPECSKLVYDALIEHYIHVWVKSPESEKKEYEEKVLRILRDPEANYDRDQTLIICQTLGFKPGVLYMYEENKLWRSQVSLYLREGQAEAALAVCRRRAALCPALWLDVLWHPPPAACLPELLHVIDTEKLLSRTLVVDCLASHSAYTLGDVRKYLMDILKNENEVIAREQELARKYRGEGERMKAHIQRIQREPVVFQSSRCAACTKLLELPSVHFLCQHSFHKHCFESLCESECECPSCEAPPRAPPPAPDSLHARLLAEPDPYSVVSEYYGRGLFNKLTVVTESEEAAPAPASAPVPAPAPAPAPAYGAGAEAKLRMQEGQSKQLFVPNAPKQIAPKGSSVVPVPEGRMRLMEQQQYSSSLEANLTRLEPVHTKKPSPFASPRAAKRIVLDQPKTSKPPVTKLEGSNPFDEHYDESKNPFADEQGDDPTNPFAGDDDYDSNYNPFAKDD